MIEQFVALIQAAEKSRYSSDRIGALQELEAFFLQNEAALTSSTNILPLIGFEHPEYYKWHLRFEIGSSYIFSTSGDRPQNIETGISVLKSALQLPIVAHRPDCAAMTEGELSIAYKNRPLGQKKENLREAIAYNERTFVAFTEASDPAQWVASLCQRAVLAWQYSKLASDEPQTSRDDIERDLRIVMLKAREYGNPELSRVAQTTLASILAPGPNAPPDDIRAAIQLRKGVQDELQSLRTVASGGADPSLLHEAMVNDLQLGQLYLDAPGGDRLENARAAIACLSASKSYFENTHMDGAATLATDLIRVANARIPQRTNTSFQLRTRPDMPLTTFDGPLKQIAINSATSEMAQLFSSTFSSFAEIEEHRKDLLNAGIVVMQTPDGPQYNFGYRPRRFAGGGGLAPASYFSLCEDDRFDDHGSLRDELIAYYSGDSGVVPSLFDSQIDTWVIEMLRKSGLDEVSLADQFLAIFFEIARPTKGTQNFESNARKYASTYGVSRGQVCIEGVVDLRLSETQRWFMETFVRLELEAEADIAKLTGTAASSKAPLQDFSELLRAICTPEVGGGMMFNQAIGHWLRRNGANALIYPSARSNPQLRVVNGRPVSFKGWNLVSFSGAAPVEDVRLFGRTRNWFNPRHSHMRVLTVNEGNERGSIYIRGQREFNLLRFDFEKQIATGFRARGTAGELNGELERVMSTRVNDVLDFEATQRDIWRHDTNFHRFVLEYEDMWRPG